MMPNDIIKLYERCGAVWFFDYEGDPQAPHAELTGGDCSDGYINSALVTSRPSILTYVVGELVPYLYTNC